MAAGRQPPEREGRFVDLAQAPAAVLFKEGIVRGLKRDVLAKGAEDG